MNYNKLSDEELCARVKEKDVAAENAIINRYKELIYHIANTYFVIGSDKDDLVQIGMIGIYNAARTFNGKSGFKTYAYICVKREILSFIRKTNAKKNIIFNTSVSIEDNNAFSDCAVTSAVDPETEIINSETEKEIIEKIKKQLSEKEYKIFNLYLEGYSYLEIASKIGATEKSVDNALQRIRRKSSEIYGS